MRMDERLKLTNRESKDLLVWAHLRIRTGDEIVGNIVQPADTITFTIHSTKRNRDFLADTTALKAFATRSMPKRKLDVESVRPTPDRKYLVIECRG